MTSSPPRRITLVGIDGSGKSVLTKRLSRVATTRSLRFKLLTCPVYHETPNIPLTELSRAMDRFSRGADRDGDHALKGISLYLQMTLFGPIARTLEEIYRPELLLYERHPLIDALAYGPLYRRMLSQASVPEDYEERIRHHVEPVIPGGTDQIFEWFQLYEGARGVPFERYHEELVRLFSLETGPLLESLAERFRASLPDVVVMIDVDPEEAFRRISGRDGEKKEIHETAEMLGFVRSCYLDVLGYLDAHEPAVETKIIRISEGEDPEGGMKDVLA